MRLLDQQRQLQEDVVAVQEVRLLAHLLSTSVPCNSAASRSKTLMAPARSVKSRLFMDYTHLQTYSFSSSFYARKCASEFRCNAGR